MTKKTMKLSLDLALLNQAERAVENGHADSLESAVEAGLKTWLRALGTASDDLDIEFDEYADLLLRSRVSIHNSSIDVMGDDSYVTEIEFAQDAFRDYGDFAKIPLKAREHVSGFGDSNGYLGRMEGAAIFKPVVRKNPQAIGEHLDQLPIAGPVSTEVLHKVLHGLCSVHGVGLPSASRLLAVKRPDLFFPVNGANREEVVERYGAVRVLPGPAADDYLRIIARVHEYPWFNQKRPAKSDVEKRTIWDYRVALLDALLYAPTEEDEEDESDDE